MASKDEGQHHPKTQINLRWKRDKGNESEEQTEDGNKEKQINKLQSPNFT